jgi:hypothetical protein
MTREGNFPDLHAFGRLNRTQFFGKIDFSRVLIVHVTLIWQWTRRVNHYASLLQTLIEEAPKTELEAARAA